MTFDPATWHDEIEAATVRLVASAERLTPEELAGPSLCDGWTRGHVLTHVARNADSLVNLLTWARTGVETPQYPDDETRDAEIEAGAGRPLADLIADLQAASARFAEAMAEVPDGAWDVEVRWRSGKAAPARGIPVARLREVEIHHVDLDAGYTPAHWDAAFVEREMAQAVRAFAARDGIPAIELVATDGPGEWRLGSGPAARVSGPRPGLFAWLIGRSSGDGLTVDEGPLPHLPAWS
jgi:maleylpyruvate isomerase